MKAIYQLLIALVITTTINAQTLKRTYYDYQKIVIYEEYYINSKGEMNGKYKEFSRNGLLTIDANYLNGVLEGTVIKYATYSGKSELASKETYKAGELNGPATYYGQKGLVLRQGNYKQGKRDGKWTLLDPYTNYDLNDQQKKGADYIKSEVYYINDEPVINGKVKTYYYPSGTLCSEQEYKNGKKVGTHIYYNPNGSRQYRSLYDSTGVRIVERNYTNECWKSILAQDYPTAISIGEEGVKSDATSLYISGNLAHAYLLNGEYDKAMVIYKMYMGKYLNATTSWNDMVKQDFAKFKEKGIISADMDKALAELGIK